jgi:hypothetical protein
MSEVVVDAPPTPRLPYDSSIIPEAVRKRVERVEALYKPPVAPTATDSKPPQAAEPVSEGQLSLPLDGTPAAQPPTSPSPTPSAAVVPLEDENSQSYKHRFLAMQGRYNATTKQIGEMQEQMNQLGNELLYAQRVAQQRTQPLPQVQQYITDQDVKDYGTDLLSFAQRAAADAVAPRFQSLEQQNQALQRQLAEEARARMDMRVERDVPNYREIDNDPRWHQWLLGIDQLSGRVRQTLLDEAVSAADAPRAVSFFKSFLRDEEVTGHRGSASSQQVIPPREAAMSLESLAAPGRARPTTGGESSVSPDRPIYTPASIQQLYRMHQKGAYFGREAEWARQEADIFAAQREGRVRR